MRHRWKWSALATVLITWTSAGFAHPGFLGIPTTEPDDWKAPPNEGQKENPVPADKQSTEAGKVVYTQQCLICHGTTGKGDGPAAAALPRKPDDLADPRTRAQTDGALFWKITTGKAPMPSYEKLLTDRQRWDAVNYVRTLEPKKK